MGVHTGDSITVAPALTLTDKEYQIMRDASLAVLREIGVETGGSNVQFGINPADGRMVVIEMNPRVSRSSALASKATGFPIAKVAARLAVGYTLDELENDITGGATPASFEPTIDYVVTKIPRFAFEKFPGADNASPLDEVGRRSHGHRPHLPGIAAEGLPIAGNRPQRSKRRWASPALAKATTSNAIKAAIGTPTPQRLLLCRRSHAAWVVSQRRHLRRLQDRSRGFSSRCRASSTPSRRCASSACRRTPQSCARSRPWASPMAVWRNWPIASRPMCASYAIALASARSSSALILRQLSSPRPPPICIRPTRLPSPASPKTRRVPSDRKKVVILGGGPNRIGQGIEFDYCCCHAAFALADAGYETIMVNCNPETVSTDYDTSDRLYFEPLTEEDVIEILTTEKQAGTLHGVIVQFGGQTPLNLAEAVQKAGVPILGTQPDAIDLAEDRDLFSKLLNKLELTQPKNGIAYSLGTVAARGRTSGLSAGDPPLLCAGRPRHGHRALRQRIRALCSGYADRPCAAGNPQPLPQRQDRADQFGPLRQSALV
jgi:carbamoyl-phosphate synthase large subunit